MDEPGCANNNVGLFMEIALDISTPLRKPWIRKKQYLQILDVLIVAWPQLAPLLVERL